MEKDLEDKLCSLEEAEEFDKKRNYKYEEDLDDLDLNKVNVVDWLTPEEIEIELKKLEAQNGN